MSAAAANADGIKESVSLDVKRAFPLRVYGRRRPGGTASSTAVPEVLLTRKGSQVQTLSRPPAPMALWTPLPTLRARDLPENHGAWLIQHPAGPPYSRQFGAYEQLDPVTGLPPFCALLNLSGKRLATGESVASRRGAARFADGTEMAVRAH
jgi:hypothetical protein